MDALSKNNPYTHATPHCLTGVPVIYFDYTIFKKWSEVPTQTLPPIFPAHLHFHPTETIQTSNLHLDLVDAQPLNHVGRALTSVKFQDPSL